MKKLIPLYLLCIVFISCSKDGQSPPIIIDPPMGSNLLVTGVITNLDSLIFAYNTDNSLSRYADFGFTNGTLQYITQYYPLYKDDMADRFFFKGAGPGDSTLAFQLAYDSKGNISTLTDRRPGKAGDHDSIVYDIRGKMTERYLFRGTLPATSIRFTYEGGDIVKMVEIFKDNAVPDTATTTYTYVDKINPFHLLGLVPYLDYNKSYYFFQPPAGCSALYYQ